MIHYLEYWNEVMAALNSWHLNLVSENICRLFRWEF